MKYDTAEAMGELPDRDQIILRGRQQKMTLEAIGILLNINRESVRRIEKRANRKLEKRREAWEVIQDRWFPRDA